MTKNLLILALLSLCIFPTFAQADAAMSSFNLGNEYMVNLEYSRAIDEYSETIRLRPDFHRAFFMRGNAQNFLGSSQAALSDYNAAIALAPDFSSAYFQRGVVLFHSNNIHGAIADWEKVLELEPGHAPARQNIETARRLLRGDEGSPQASLVSETGQMVFNISLHPGSEPVSHTFTPPFGFPPMTITFAPAAQAGQMTATFESASGHTPMSVTALPSTQPGQLTFNLSPLGPGSPASSSNSFILSPALAPGPMTMILSPAAQSGQLVVTLVPQPQAQPAIITAIPIMIPPPQPTPLPPPQPPPPQPAPQPAAPQPAAPQPAPSQSPTVIVINPVTPRPTWTPPPEPPPVPEPPPPEPPAADPIPPDPIADIPQPQTPDDSSPGLTITINNTIQRRPPRRASAPTVRIIPGLPEPTSGRIYNLQVGAWYNEESAASVIRQLQRAGFQPAQERSENMFRVYAANVPASIVYYAIQRLGNMGFSEVWIRAAANNN